MAWAETAAARNRAILLPATAVQPGIEGEGTTGEIHRRTEAQSADKMLELLSAIVAETLRTIFHD